MSALHPITAYLARFDRSPSALEQTPNVFADFDAPPLEAFAHGAEAASEESTAATKVLAIREEIRAELEAEYLQSALDERARFDAQLAAERRRWTEEEGKRLSKQLKGAVAQCSQELKEAAARVIGPFVTRAVLERSLEDFIGTVRTMVADQDAPLIHFFGPDDLLDIVRARLAEDNISIKATKTDTVDVKARIDSTLVETRMEEWAARLRSGD